MGPANDVIQVPLAPGQWTGDLAARPLIRHAVRPNKSPPLSHESLHLLRRSIKPESVAWVYKKRWPEISVFTTPQSLPLPVPRISLQISFAVARIFARVCSSEAACVVISTRFPPPIYLYVPCATARGQCAKAARGPGIEWHWPREGEAEERATSRF